MHSTRTCVALLGPLFALALLGCTGPAGTADASDVPVSVDADVTDTAVIVDASGDSTPGAITIAPGEAVEVPVAALRTGARIATPTGNERFVIVLASTVFDAVAGTTFDYTVGTPPAGTDAVTATPAHSCSINDAHWRNTPPVVDPPPTGTAPAIGFEDTFQVPTSTVPRVITARVIAVGTSAVVWADVTAANPAVLDMAFVTEFLSAFDQLILPRERAIFGTESDVDGDGHIALLFSPITNQTAVAFFSGCDLVRLAGCRNFNHREVLYLTPPAAIRPPYNTPNAIKEILAHELQHLIHFNRRVVRNSLSGWNDNANLLEGLGGFAQDASGYQAGNLYVAMAGLNGVDAFSFGDILPDNGRYDLTRDGVLRGVSYLFARWLYDHAGGDTARPDGTIEGHGGPALLRALEDGTRTAASVLPEVSSAPMTDIAVDFYTALAMSNREDHGGVTPTNACFRYLPVAMDPVTVRPRGANLYADVHGMPMTGPATQPLATADGSLRAGGVEYLSLDAAVGSPEIAFTLDVPDDALARIRIVRVR